MLLDYIFITILGKFCNFEEFDNLAKVKLENNLITLNL